MEVTPRKQKEGNYKDKNRSDETENKNEIERINKPDTSTLKRLSKLTNL